MKRKWQKKVTGVLAGAMLAGSAFGGANPVCAEEGADLEPMEISVALWGIQEGFDAANAVNDTIFNDLCEKFNITINPVSVTWNDYQEKNKVWAASGSLPDLFCDALATDNNAGNYQRNSERFECI